MKSKSLDLGHASGDKVKHNHTHDFINLYKSTAETNTSLNKKCETNNDKETHKIQSESPKRERSPIKRKEKKSRDSVNISQITIESPGLNSSGGGSTPLNESKATSTPLGNFKNQGKSNDRKKVKSIMKLSVASDVPNKVMDESNLDVSDSKPKKRNKSVSFMLEDNEEVIVKKTKSNMSVNENNGTPSLMKAAKTKKHLKDKKAHHTEKENKINVKETMDVDNMVKEKKARKKHRTKADNQETPVETIDSNQLLDAQTDHVSEVKKKSKRIKKIKKPEESTESNDKTAVDGTNHLPEKPKKPKKKKRKEKHDIDIEEPVMKSRKKDIKPDVIADLENLSIGDNAHTLTNLLDEMTVVDKEKRKKLKQQFNKNKKPKGPVKTEDSKTEDSQEKIKKWRRRKWNKDIKADSKEDSLDTTIIVENLPLSLLFSYKKLLAERFVKYGLVKNVGIAEVYPTEVSKSVFTTTIVFYSDGAATLALQEDKATFEGSIIKVKRPLPPTETTLVIRSYGVLTTQCISSIFNSAGRIRNIRHLVKGKHAMATFFIEFDGPESVERAMKIAADIKIGGKKIYVSKFETRTKKKKPEKTNNSEGSDADQSEDSQD